jgi:NADH-quinone oxidoreductase subunit N
VAALLRAPGDYHAWYWFLACAAVANTALSMAYAARVLRAMYLEPDTETSPGPLLVHGLHAAMALALTIPTVLLGVWWGPLYDFLSERVTTLP